VLVVEVAGGELERRRGERGGQESRRPDQHEAPPVDAAEHVSVAVGLGGVTEKVRRLADVARGVQDRRDREQLEEVDGGEAAPARGGERQRHHGEHDPATRGQADQAEGHGP
jgi:hypothetical protein